MNKTPQQWADQWIECIQYGEFGASFNPNKAKVLFKLAMSQAWNEALAKVVDDLESRDESHYRLAQSFKEWVNPYEES